MLVNRRTFIVKKPYFEEALALLVEYRTTHGCQCRDARLCE
jgi:hypothetical protein